MGKPFKIAQPASKNAAKYAPRPANNPAKTVAHAQDEQESLVEAAAEEMTPDYDVSSAKPKEAGQNRGEDHVQRPAYAPSHPWPPAKATSSKPFKI